MKYSVANIVARVPQAIASARFARLARLIKRSGAFDAPWYQATYPDATGWDAAVHYLAIGAARGHRPHVLFDPQWWVEVRGCRRHRNVFIDYLTAPERWALPPSPYLALRPGLASAQLPRQISPLGLYHTSMGQEGLAPSPLFDAEFYKKNNPDVVEAGFDPLLHYISSGGREGRSPCVSFDAFWYLTVNPDVRAQGEEPLRHFLMRGALQGRAPHRAIDLPTLVANSRATRAAEALAHYQVEGRRFPVSTHRRLPPPGATMRLFDDWPWRNGTIASARGRLLIIVAGYGHTNQTELLHRLVARRTGPEIWLVALDASAADAMSSIAAPLLNLTVLPHEALPSLIRAAVFAGPYLTLAVHAPQGHIVHELAAASGIALTTLADADRSQKAAAEPRVAESISVVVPCYNHAAFLDKRLSSIIAQRRPPLEIIIIDDASQDDSLPLARAFADRSPLPVRVIAREHNSGSPFITWAEGARLARGELLWIAESDDLADPRLLERLAPFLETDPATVLAYCQSGVIGARGERLADDHLFYTDDIDSSRWETPYLVPGEEEIGKALAIKNTIPNVSAVLFRRQALQDVVAQIASDRYCGDWRAYSLLAARGRVGFSPEPLNQTRRHGGNATMAGERDLLAIREAQEIRLALWRRPDVSAKAIRAGYAQHIREVEVRRQRHMLPDAPFEEAALREAVAGLLRERKMDSGQTLV